MVWGYFIISNFMVIFYQKEGNCSKGSSKYKGFVIDKIMQIEFKVIIYIFCIFWLNEKSS